MLSCQWQKEITIYIKWKISNSPTVFREKSREISNILDWRRNEILIFKLWSFSYFQVKSKIQEKKQKHARLGKASSVNVYFSVVFSIEFSMTKYKLCAINVCRNTTHQFRSRYCLHRKKQSKFGYHIKTKSTKYLRVLFTAQNFVIPIANETMKKCSHSLNRFYSVIQSTAAQLDVFQEYGRARVGAS